ncbi:ERAD-associated protein [Coelomomyces lativittatus]|nr:ERAD-associated protein [Coelomomyces lativittatus]
MGWILILFSVSVCFISSIETVQNENHPAVPPTLVYHNEPSSNHQPKIDETVSLSTSAPTEFDSSATSTLKLGEPIYQEALYILNELDRSYPHYHHLGHAYVDSILHFSTVLDDKNSFSKWTWTSYFTWNFIYEDFVKVVFDFISTIVSSPFSFSPSSSLEPLPPTRSTLAKYMSNVHQAIGFLEKAWHEFKHVNAGHLLATIYFYGNYSLPLRPSLAFPLFQQLSQHVYPNVIDAHYYLGWFYATNFGHVLNSTHLVDETLQTKDSPPSSTQDPVKDTTVFTTTQQPRAHLHFQLAASYGNHTLAEMTMGYRHTAGIGCAISCEKSLPYFYNVARKVMDVYYAGPPGGQSLPSSPNRLYLDEGGMYGPGSVFGKGGKSESAITEEDAFEYYKYLADNGDIESQYVLGMSFYLGTESVPKHYLRSLRYFGLAANTVFEGHEPKHHAILAAKASGWVGRMYLRGEGVVANNATAQRWFTKGAKHHDLQSLTYLGILAIDKFMARGPNIMPNEEVEVAVKYLQTAAKQDFPEAQSYLGRFYYGKYKYSMFMYYYYYYFLFILVL